MSESETHDSFLRPGFGIDHDHPAIQAFVGPYTTAQQQPVQRAVELFYAVRDGWRYYPYRISLSREALRASRVLEKAEGHCLDKGILLTAAYRAAGLPARLCLAKVRNHIAAEKMIEVFGTDELVPHGYVEVWLEGRWYKVTPAFNRELCLHLQVDPLEFDGTSDALFQQYDRRGGVFMDYLEDYGPFEDVPYERILELMCSHYPHLFRDGIREVDRARMIELRESR